VNFVLSEECANGSRTSTAFGSLTWFIKFKFLKENSAGLKAFGALKFESNVFP